MDATQQDASNAIRRPRKRRQITTGLLGAAAAAGLVVAGIAPAHAAGSFERTISPLGCFGSYTVSGGSYSTNTGAAAFTSRTSATCIVLPWQDVGAVAQRGTTYGPLQKGSTYAQSTVRGSGTVRGTHYYQNEANVVYT